MSKSDWGDWIQDIITFIFRLPVACCPNMSVSKVKIKILELVQRHYAILGITPSNQSPQKYSFNRRVFFGFLLFGCVIVLHMMYIFRVANGFMDYIVCICSLSGNTITFICFAAVVFKSNLLFEMIGNMETLIDTSESLLDFAIHDFIDERLKIQLKCSNSGRKYPESSRFFLKISHQIEQLSELVFIAVVEVALQCYMLPKLIVSYAVYFITDTGADSFQLPLPLW